jgi:hypothetical protein
MQDYPPSNVQNKSNGLQVVGTKHARLPPNGYKQHKTGQWLQP